MAALDQALSDRNTLSNQNTQLWKLIEKQRTGYNQILKELERVRNERDLYKLKLGAASGGLERRHHSQEREKTRKFSDASASIAETASISGDSVSLRRESVTRTYSDDQRALFFVITSLPSSHCP